MKIWQAYGPNYSDDSRVGSPDYGIFQGEKEDVVDWIDTIKPGFRDHLEGREYPGAELKEIKPKEVNREMVERLRLALRQKVEAEESLRLIQG